MGNAKNTRTKRQACSSQRAGYSRDPSAKRASNHPLPGGRATLWTPPSHRHADAHTQALMTASARNTHARAHLNGASSRRCSRQQAASCFAASSGRTPHSDGITSSGSGSSGGGQLGCSCSGVSSAGACRHPSLHQQQQVRGTRGGAAEVGAWEVLPALVPPAHQR